MRVVASDGDGEGEREWAVEGRAVDLGGTVEPRSVVRAIRGESASVAVECPSPGPVHEHVGHVHEEMCLDLRGALAAAARSVGETAPQAEALTEARAELASLDVAETDLEAARRRLAEADASETRLRERVATLRGRVQALAEAEAPEARADAREALEDAVRELTEVETERIAAEQVLERAERAARDARDRRERRLELQDRVANLRRDVRRSLAAAVYDRFRAAVVALPGAGRAGDAPGDYEGDPVTAALAVARIADVTAPVVLEADRFDDAATAARRLDAPVVWP
jgi:TolA-binding protein